MIERHELSALAKSLGRAVKEYVAAALTAITARLDAFEERLRSIPAGLPGKDGIAGKDGVDGRNGLDGKDADYQRVSEFVTTEITKAVAALPVPKDGTAGIAGKDGACGDKGLDGKDGRDGREGKDGRDGLNGRDAIEIEIQEFVEGKVYPRGAFLRHRGGISRIAGDNLAQVMVEGIFDIEICQAEDLRTFSIKLILTSGSVRESKFATPVLIYREIFKEGVEYQRGDVVTWGGSAWHCQAESTKAKPGTGNEWKLMVKEGRAGKDGKDGERGPEGQPGKDLRPLGSRL